MSQLTLNQALQLAIQHHDAGQLPIAEALYRQILTQNPNHPEALLRLGILAGQVERWDDSLILLNRAAPLLPHSPDAFYNLARAQHAKDQLDPAIANYQQALALQHNLLPAHLNLGQALAQKGRADDAISCFQRALSIDPDNLDALNALGATLAERGQLEPAVACFQRALTRQPDHIDSNNNLGVALLILRQPDRAIACFQNVLAQHPNDATACNNLAKALKDLGQIDDALAICQRARQISPRDPMIHSNYLLMCHYHPSADPQALTNEARLWNQQHAPPLPIPAFAHHPNDPTPDRPLRIGYVSPDLRAHSVGRFLLPLLQYRDRANFHTICYSASPTPPDSFTDRLRAATDEWRDIAPLPDAHAADLIHADRIDILIDLAGHTAHNRLLLFARKPAPLQVTYLGYPATTGLTTIDYRLTDLLADPPDQTERWHTEQLLRLPQSAWCYQPPSDDIPVRPPPSEKNGYITFGCFNNLPKITPVALELWARLLHAVPSSHLLLKSPTLGNASAQNRIRNLLSAAGVAPARVELRGWLSGQAAHLSAYHDLDIALDTFPYHGTATTCEALWMGVPVITLAGQNHVTRVGVSLLTNALLPELIASSPDEYLHIASALANDRPRLTTFRQTFRDRLQHSPLMDAPRFARDIEAAYRKIWHLWCITHSTPPSPSPAP